MHLIKLTGKRRNNLKNFFFFIFLLLLFTFCGKNKPEILQHDLPADSVIPRNQMVKMLADMHILEAALPAVKKKGTNEQQMAVFYYRQFFSNYHVSEKRFRMNLANYQSKTEQFSLLYKDVVKALEKQISLRKTLNSKIK